MIAKLLLLVFISECSSLNDTKFYAAAIDRGRVVDVVVFWPLNKVSWIQVGIQGVVICESFFFFQHVRP